MGDSVVELFFSMSEKKKKHPRKPGYCLPTHRHPIPENYGFRLIRYPAPETCAREGWGGWLALWYSELQVPVHSIAVSPAVVPQEPFPRKRKGKRSGLTISLVA